MGRTPWGLICMTSPARQEVLFRVSSCVFGAIPRWVAFGSRPRVRGAATSRANPSGARASRCPTVASILRLVSNGSWLLIQPSRSIAAQAMHGSKSPSQVTASGYAPSSRPTCNPTRTPRRRGRRLRFDGVMEPKVGQSPGSFELDRHELAQVLPGVCGIALDAYPERDQGNGLVYPLDPFICRVNRDSHRLGRLGCWFPVR